MLAPRLFTSAFLIPCSILDIHYGHCEADRPKQSAKRREVPKATVAILRKNGRVGLAPPFTQFTIHLAFWGENQISPAEILFLVALL
jgi:hypothetical protein